MATAVRVPKATITLEEAQILGWRKQPGEFVRKDEILFEMETDKVVVEVPSPTDGVLLGILVTEGTARVEQAVAWLGELGEEIPEPPAPKATPVPGALSETAASVGQANATGIVTSSPAARRRARELGVDLAIVQATGPGGRITEQDVERVGRSL
jgi:pyruvate/2-oxoglutarate dehydrogenase complex dihydrolipoamide acyltransferase (E2) component